MSNSALLDTRWIVYRAKLDDAKSMKNEPNFNVDLRENDKSLGLEFHLMKKARWSIKDQGWYHYTIREYCQTSYSSLFQTLKS